MTLKSIKTWSWLHKWSSLVCTLFLLLLCVTGLPLIFSEEIDEWLHPVAEVRDIPANTPLANLDIVLATAKQLHPSLVPLYLFHDLDNDKTWTISMGETPASEDHNQFIRIDARTSQVLNQPKLDEGFMYFVLKLHVDLFAGLPGMLFLGLMGLLFVIALISGVVLYAPFMRRLTFGTIRKSSRRYIQTLDTHNFLGVTTLAWTLVVGLTGVINAWSELVIHYWQTDQMAAMTADYKDLPPLGALGSLQASVNTAQRLEPDMKLSFAAFPGTDFSSPHHYTIYMRGNTPMTARLFKPVLVDAQTAQLTDSREIPWYLAVLLISQPLHFGDYGGLPLKILWAVFDIITIVVLWTGLKLWWKKRHASPHYLGVANSLAVKEPAADGP